MDRDGDGKLYLKEVLAYVRRMKELSSGAMASVVTLRLAEVQRSGRAEVATVTLHL